MAEDKKSLITVSRFYNFAPSVGDIGIEIEMEGNRGFPVPPSDWVTHADGSLRGYSVEYVSNGPVPFQNLSTHLANLKKTLEASKIKIHHSFRAGVHCHINVRDFNIEQIASFACLYYIFEHALVKYCGDSREGNHFCLRIEDAEAPIFFLLRALRNEDFDIFSTDNLRYASLNLSSINRHGSLEFRAMETLPTLEKILPWATILYKFKEYARESSRKEYAKDISLLGPEGFLERIIGKELVDEISYPNFSSDALICLRRIHMLLV